MSTVAAERGAWDLWHYLPRAFPYLRPYRKNAAFSFLLMILNSLVHLAQPWPLAIMIDSVIGSQPLPPLVAGILPADNQYLLLAILVGLGFGLTVVGNALTVFNSYVDVAMEQRMILDFRSDLFEHCQKLSLTFHDARKTGELMSRINYQAASVGNVVMAFPPIIQSVMTLVGMLVIAIVIDWKIALISLVVVPFLYWSAGCVRKANRPPARARSEPRVAVAVDRPRVDGDAPRHRLVWP